VPHYRSVGDVPRKRHTHHHDGDGNRYAEELVGQEGFSSASSLLYHRHSPSAVVAIEPVELPPGAAAPATADHPLSPRHLRTSALADRGGDLVTGRHTLLANDDVAISWVESSTSSELHRDATGDHLVYVQHGNASCSRACSAGSSCTPATTWWCPAASPTAGWPPATSRSACS
jgi:homogentisate 1,2-dioxygenase